MFENQGEGARQMIGNLRDEEEKREGVGASGEESNKHAKTGTNEVENSEGGPIDSFGDAGRTGYEIQ